MEHLISAVIEFKLNKKDTKFVFPVNFKHSQPLVNQNSGCILKQKGKRNSGDFLNKMNMIISSPCLKEGHAKTFRPLPDTTPQFSKRIPGYFLLFVVCEYIFQAVEKETH